MLCTCLLYMNLQSYCLAAGGTHNCGHRLSTIVDADNIAVVRAGKVVEQGTHGALMQITGEGVEGRGWGAVSYGGVRNVGEVHPPPTCVRPTPSPCLPLRAGGIYAGLISRQQLVADQDEQGLRSKYGGKWLAATKVGPPCGCCQQHVQRQPPP